jgi:hypothetical protein
MARKAGANPRDLDAALSRWCWKPSPKVHIGDRRGINLVAREKLDDGLVRVMQSIIDKAIRKVGSCDPFMQARDDISYTVHHVEQVINMRSWEGYSRACTRIDAAARESGAKIDPLHDLQLDAQLEAQLLAAAPSPCAQRSQRVCETFLWHGSHPASLENIVNADFKLMQAGSNAGSSLGKGLYFAEAFNKADEYCRPNSDGLYAMLLCRCALGRHRLVDSNLVDGNKGGNKWVKGMSDGGWFECNCHLEPDVSAGEYDSLLGDRRKLRFNRFREVVIFHSDQVCPAFIIWYHRHGGAMDCQLSKLTGLSACRGDRKGIDQQQASVGARRLHRPVPPRPYQQLVLQARPADTKLLRSS